MKKTHLIIFLLALLSLLFTGCACDNSVPENPFPQNRSPQKGLKKEKVLEKVIDANDASTEPEPSPDERVAEEKTIHEHVPELQQDIQPDNSSKPKSFVTVDYKGGRGVGPNADPNTSSKIGLVIDITGSGNARLKSLTFKIEQKKGHTCTAAKPGELLKVSYYSLKKFVGDTSQELKIKWYFDVDGEVTLTFNKPLTFTQNEEYYFIAGFHPPAKSVVRNCQVVYWLVPQKNFADLPDGTQIEVVEMKSQRSRAIIVNFFGPSQFETTQYTPKDKNYIEVKSYKFTHLKPSFGGYNIVRALFMFDGDHKKIVKYFRIVLEHSDGTKYVFPSHGGGYLPSVNVTQIGVGTKKLKVPTVYSGQSIILSLQLVKGKVPQGTILKGQFVYADCSDQFIRVEHEYTQPCEAKYPLKDILFTYTTP